MAQHDYNIANQTGADFRADLNNALLAISSNNSGSSEPSTMYAYEWWIDTSANVLKLRNSSNNAWITMPFSITADNTVDINAGTVNGITSLSFSSGATVTSILDEDDFSSDSATALATQQSIKAYIASQITLEDLDISDGSSTISIDLDSETLSLLGGTGVTSAASGNGVTFSIGQSVGTSDNVVFNQITGALVGNASTATALATARTISGVSFDGTANITLDTDDIGEGSSNKYFTAERVDDQVNTLLTAGTGITLTYNDAAGTLTIDGQTGDITSVVAGDGLTGGGTSGDVTLAVGVDDSSIEINSDAIRVKATGITNAMLAGSIANSKLANSSITVNSQAIALGGSHTFDTDDIGEGSSNLYYTDSRSNSAIDARVTNTFINNLSGVVADTATALATGRTIGLSGDVTASGVSFDGTGNITLSTTIAANSIALGTDTVGNYVATIAGSTNEIEVSGSGSETATVTIGLPDDVTIAGNLTVNGTTTTVNSDTLSVTDPLIKLAKANNGADSLDIGFYGLYDTSGSQDLYAGLFRDANDSGKFKLFKDLQVEPTTTVNTSGTGYAVGTLVSNLEGDVTGNVTGNITGSSGSTTGNAATATALATGRTIGMTGDVVWTSASFDGSGNVTGTATIQANSVALGTDTTGDYVSTVTAGTGLTSTGATSGEGIAHSLSVDAAQTQITSVGTLTGLTVNGDVTFTGSSNNIVFDQSDDCLEFADNAKAKFGASDDLQIYHDGNNSRIQEAGTGSLLLRGTNLQLQDSDGFDYLTCTDGGDGGTVVLKHLGSAVLSTASGGITVTGTVNNMTIADSGFTCPTSQNFIINSPNAFRINIDSNNDGTAEAFTVGHNQDTAANTNVLFNITESGKASIGHSAANANLHVGSSNATGDATNPAIQIGGSSTYRLGMYTSAEGAVIENKNGDDGLQFRVKTAGEAVRIDATGHVLVGKTSGTSGNKIETDGRISAGAGSSGQPTFNCEGDTNTGINLPESDRIQLITGGSERMRIDSSGNLGLGESSPENILHIKNADSGSSYTADGGDLVIIENNNSAGIDIRTPTGDAGALYFSDTTRARGAIIYYHSLDDMYFNVAGTSGAMVLNSSGNLLIGVTSAQDPSSSTTAGHTFYGGSTGVAIHSRSNGNPLALQRTGSDGAAVNFFKTNSVVGSISLTSSATAYNTSSDARLKVVTGSARGLDVINNLNPVAFSWKADNHADEGFIAQEVEKLVPNAVNQDDNGYYQMDYSKLVTHLVKAMQEQQEQIELLNKKIKNIEEK